MAQQAQSPSHKMKYVNLGKSGLKVGVNPRYPIESR